MDQTRRLSAILGITMVLGCDYFHGWEGPQPQGTENCSGSVTLHSFGDGVAGVGASVSCQRTSTSPVVAKYIPVPVHGYDCRWAVLTACQEAGLRICPAGGGEVAFARTEDKWVIRASNCVWNCKGPDCGAAVSTAK